VVSPPNTSGKVEELVRGVHPFEDSPNITSHHILVLPPTDPLHDQLRNLSPEELRLQDYIHLEKVTEAPKSSPIVQPAKPVAVAVAVSKPSSSLTPKPVTPLGAQTVQMKYDRDKLFPEVQPRRLETAGRYFLPDTKRQQPRAAAPRPASARPRPAARTDPALYAHYFKARARDDGHRFAPPVLRITADAIVTTAPSAAVDISAGPLTVKKVKDRIRFTHNMFGFADFTLPDDAELPITSPDVVVFGPGYFDINWGGDVGNRAEGKLSSASVIVKLLGVRPRHHAKRKEDYTNDLMEYCTRKKLVLIDYQWESQTLWFYAQSCRDGPYDFAAAEITDATEPDRR
jgi:hypothetical protein